MFSDDAIHGTPMHLIKAYLPVNESFGKSLPKRLSYLSSLGRTVRLTCSKVSCQRFKISSWQQCRTYHITKGKWISCISGIHLSPYKFCYILGSFHSQVSPLTFAPTPVARLSLSVYSTIGRSSKETQCLLIASLVKL